MLRRRARLSAALIWARGQPRRRGPGPGPWPAVPGCRRRPGPRTPPARRGSTRAARAAAAAPCRVRSQISVLCIRATTLTASASALSPATGRSWWASVRTMSASMCASPRRSWRPTPRAVPGTGRPATGSPRTPCTRRRPARPPTGPGRSRSRPRTCRVIGVRAELPADQRVQPRHPRHALGQPRLGQHPARPRPSPPHRDAPRPSHLPRTAAPISRPRCPSPSAASGRTISDLMKQCSRPNRAGTTSHQRSTLPVTGRGTIFRQDSNGPGGKSAHPPAATSTESAGRRPGNSH